MRPWPASTCWRRGQAPESVASRPSRIAPTAIASTAVQPDGTVPFASSPEPYALPPARRSAPKATQAPRNIAATPFRSAVSRTRIQSRSPPIVHMRERWPR